ncbi:MAG TPA: AAA family ATPase [Spirochaetota bacterium]|nr:AAA family ATPase [Spirochaetota bacterium]HPI89839.1 AAA family ATPase [Spirochaetota bacterium]HPR48648.1 AAA family ATPase [Spirochaetota bacterium]
MFLKSMELFGFKSFADRTQVEFESGITCIVGPNGCGKSNVVDAIKWVLGEKQARNIRGITMEDIIFSGTEQRKQVSLAEVSLTIDNSQRILDFDSDSVTVSRRVFRDGESEYLINKSPVRLKDIEKLFLDTGIGKSSYSVMEQGKMDLILSTRAEDRRYIFEEAAGISRYKLQKKESLKKLQETGENLNRINDIIKEIEREKDLKAKQAERTKSYLALRSQLTDLDVKISYIRYTEYQSKQEKIQEQIDRMQREREAISARVSTISADNEKDEKRKNDLQHQLFELEKRLHAYKIRVEDIDSKTEKNREMIGEQQARKESLQKKIEERSRSRKDLLTEKERTVASGIEIRQKIKDDNERLEKFFETRKRKIASIHGLRDKIEKNKASISDSEERLKSLRGELEVVIKRLVDAIDKRKAELQDSEDERNRVLDRIHTSFKEVESFLGRAIQSLESGITEEALAALRAIDLASLKSDFLVFQGYEDGFRSILFDKAGIHAEKQVLDGKIGSETKAIDDLRTDIAMLEESIRNEQDELEDVNGMITKVEKDLSRNENEKDWIEKHILSLDHQIRDVDKQIESYGEDMNRSDRAIENFSKEIQEWEARLIEFNERSQSLMQNIRETTEKRTEIDRRIVERKSLSKKDEEELEKIIEKIGSLDKSQVELIFKKNSIEDHLWVEYEKKVSEMKNISAGSFQLNDLQQQMQEVKKSISDLGPVNNLAIEEYRDLKKRFEYYINQKKDIEKAREDIISVIEDINKTSIEIFLSTFKEIQKNFSEVFRRLFEGGDASLELVEQENVLESGIDIMVRPPGKKQKNINLLSGGERALTAIALLFATYMVKPSPFCFLDEIDAPLDEENISRFVKMLREFSRGTQFIIVTHNKKTMSIAESIYGVTMEEPGISKLVSLRMEKLEKKQAEAG